MVVPDSLQKALNCREHLAHSHPLLPTDLHLSAAAYFLPALQHIQHGTAYSKSASVFACWSCIQRILFKGAWTNWKMNAYRLYTRCGSALLSQPLLLPTLEITWIQVLLVCPQELKCTCVHCCIQFAASNLLPKEIFLLFIFLWNLHRNNIHALYSVHKKGFENSIHLLFRCRL